MLPHEREAALANTFRVLGHVAHLVQDVAAPAHVRSDCWLPFGSGGEEVMRAGKMRAVFRSRWRWLGLALAGLVALVLVGANSPRTIRGQVLDAQTRQPIAGAVVLGVWTRVAGLPGLHHSELVGVREVETDAEGRFALERPLSLPLDEESVTIYKFGYVAWNNLYIFPNSEVRTDQRVPPEILLERFPAGQSHRKHLSFISGATRTAMGYGHESTPKFQNATDAEGKMP